MKIELDYRWAINPIRNFGELLVFSRAAIKLIERDLQKSVCYEHILNLYFIMCACQQITSDYLHSTGLMRISTIIRNLVLNPKRYSDFSNLIGMRSITARAIELVLLELERVHSITKSPVYNFCLEFESICITLAEILYILHCNEGNSEVFHLITDIKKRIFSLQNNKYSKSLSNTYLKIPTAFKDEPLSPEDCFELVKAGKDCFKDNSTPVVFVGLRTSGCYMAPLCIAALKQNGFKNTIMVTLRPKHEFLTQEKRRIKRITRELNPTFALVDDAPYSGHAIRLSFKQLIGLGISKRSICIMVPRFDDAPVWKQKGACVPQENRLSGTSDINNCCLPKGVKIITIKKSELSIPQKLNGNWIRSELETLISHHKETKLSDITEVALRAVSGTDSDKNITSYRPRKPFPRYKRIFELRGATENMEERTVSILAVSVGQGLWGYNTKILSKELGEIVPRVLLLKDGIAFMDYPDCKKICSPLQHVQRAEFLECIRSYIIKRSQLNILTDWNNIHKIEKGGKGWRILSEVFSHGLGFYGYFYARRVRKMLSRIINHRNTSVIDGGCDLTGWCYKKSGDALFFKKIDYDEYAYDWQDIRIFDPIFDLASVIFNHDLTKKEEKELVKYFAQKFNMDENDLRKVIFLYKILYVASLSRALRIALSGNYSVGALPPKNERESILQEKLLEKCQYFLTNTVNDYIGVFSKEIPASSNPVAVFAIDIDGVLESERLGFSAASNASIRALAALKNAKIIPVLNTGRSLVESRARCEAFGIPYAIAEHGAVIWDSIKRKTIVLINRLQRHERNRLLKAIKKDKRIIIDGGFVCGLRLFIRKGKKSFPVPDLWLEKYFDNLNIHGMKAIKAPGKTDIAFDGIDKGFALQKLIIDFGWDSLPLCSIGDSLSDLPMLQISDFAFVPHNGSRKLIRALSNHKELEVAPYAYQLGLLWAVKRVVARLGSKVRIKCSYDDITRMISQHERIHKTKGSIRSLLK